MSRTLYLLVTSERPDAYLNSVAHCLLHEGIREIEFLHIQGFGDSPLTPGRIQGKKRSAAVWEYLTILLEDLAAEGQYRYFEGENAGTKIDLRQFYPPDRFKAMQETYQQCRQLEVQWTHRDISYSDLRREIATIAAKKPSPIVDVSAVKKTFIGDLVAAGVIESLESLYTFDLLLRPDYKSPWTMLFHELKPGNASSAKYNYTNLLDTPVFRECSRSLLVRKVPLMGSLILCVLLLLITLIAYFTQGPSSPLVQATLLLSSTASILSLFYSFFPVRR